MSSSPLRLSESGSSPVASSDVPVTPGSIGALSRRSGRSHRSGSSPGYPSSHGSPGMARTPSQGGRTPRGDASSPLSLLRTPANSLASLGSRSHMSRSAFGSRSGRSDRRTDDDDPTEMSGPNTTIWGTSVSVQECSAAFRAFFDGFVLSDADTAPFYHGYLQRLYERDERAVNLDCSHIRAFDASLYHKLVAYPQEVVPIADLAVHDVFHALHPDAQSEQFTVRCFNLGKEDRLRDLDPLDIDKLVSIKGMVTRTTSIIPDLKMAFFECSVCATAQEVFIERGQIAEPQVCTNISCQAKSAMRLVHNRSVFTDKQIVRIQEAPEHIPEGETPQTCSMCAWDGLVDVAKPGDRVEVTGVFRATPIRVNPRQRNVRAIYKTFVDIVHIRKLDRSSRLANDESDPTSSGEFKCVFEEGQSDEAEAAARKAEIEELATKPDLYDQLANALAPSVWEHDDLKRGVLLQLFGGRHKEFDSDSTGGTKRRGELNVLLMGDPGTAKSQLLQYVHKVAPRGIYTSGKGSSAVGLTAYVTRDPETREFVLESGALVLSDRGICCIDEFDKMSEGARSILHEAMEQQTVSVAKAGIICSLNARTSVLASANPINSKYDPTQSVVANINLGPTLLSRFDLIYLILDKPDERTDRILAQHLLALYQPGARSHAGISQRQLMHYISYAREKIQPMLGEAAADELISQYVAMRKIGSGPSTGSGATRRVITATPRQLESLIRLSEAHARMRLSQHVEPEDVAEAVRLMKVATQSAATDPETGVIDMDLITTGRSAASRSMAEHLANAMRERFRGMRSQTLGFDEVRRLMQEDTGVDIGINELRDALQSLVGEAVVKQPRPNTVVVC